MKKTIELLTDMNEIDAAMCVIVKLPIQSGY